MIKKALKAKKGAEKKLQKAGSKLKKKLRNVGASVTDIDNKKNPASANSMLRRKIEDKAKGKAKGPYHY